MSKFASTIIDALFTLTVDRDGIPHSGMKVQTVNGQVVWLNGGGAFVDGEVTLEGHGLEATVRDVRGQGKKWDLEADIDGVSFRGWINDSAPHTAGFKPASTGSGGEYKPLAI